MGVSRTGLLLSPTIGQVATSSAALLIRSAQADGMPNLSIAAWRLTPVAAVLLPYAWGITDRVS